MQPQTLPASASNYAASQRLEQLAALSAVSRQWRRMGTEFDESWRALSPTIVAILTTAQARVIADTEKYIPAVLAETAQPDRPTAVANTALIVGVTGGGQELADALALAPIRAKQAVSGGSTPWQALQAAGQWLTAAGGLLLSDTGRAAEGLQMYTRDSGGFVRMLSPPSCGRCVVLAGKFYRHNAGFSRHPPTCDCRHIPASEAIAGDFTVDPQAYFDSLDEIEQAKLVGSKANAAAVRDGADINQIVNAYRRSAGMKFAQESPIKIGRGGQQFTTEGTTRRAVAAQQQAGLRRNGPLQLRLMPETIARKAKDAEDRMRLLRLYGWVTDEPARSRGRSVFAAQRQAERNARARSRRAAAAAN